MNSPKQYLSADCIVRAWNVTFSGVNARPVTRRIYGSVAQLKPAAVEAGRAVARMIGQSPAALSVTVREA